MCLMLISFIVALGIMDGKTMHYAKTKMAQMSLQMWRRRVREKYYSSIIEFLLKSIFIGKNYIIGEERQPTRQLSLAWRNLAQVWKRSPEIPLWMNNPVSQTNNMGGRDASEK